MGMVFLLLDKTEEFKFNLLLTSFKSIREGSEKSFAKKHKQNVIQLI